MKFMKVRYTHLAFAKICTALDVNPDCSSMDLWNSFTVVDAIELITESIDALKPKS